MNIDFIVNNWKPITWGMVIFILVIIAIFILVKIFKKKCNHKFIYIDSLIIKDKPRIVGVCRKCGVSMHRKIYSLNELKEMEN